MKGRKYNSLIKLYKHKIDELRKLVVELEAKKITLEEKLSQLRSALNNEAEIAKQHPELFREFSSYHTANASKQQELVVAIGNLDIEIFGQKHEIGLYFEEMKKFGILSSRKEAGIRANKGKNEADFLAEISSGRWFKENKNS